MLEDIFDLNTFNVYSDENNYFFFRALNMADNNDVETGITYKNGQIERIRTNLERYEGEPIYSKDSNISLEEMFNHIKMHQRKDTNCISLTSNANSALTYGRGSYKDRYVMVTVPKEEIGKSVFEAGLYMMKEINKRIDNLTNLTAIQKYYLDLIDNIKSEEQLNQLKEQLNPTVETPNYFENGLINTNKIINSNYYQALNPKQNLEKDKLIMKLNIIDQNVFNESGNRLLIQTLGNAFSSLELIYYKEIPKEKIKEIPKEIMDVLGLLQQLPKDTPYLGEIKQKVLHTSIIGKKFNYANIHTETDHFSLDKMYNLTNGKVSYGLASTMYQKAFYAAKSKLRTLNSIETLKQILNDSKYNETINYIKDNTYGIEPEITTRLSLDKIQISESVSLDFNKKERELFNYINNLKEELLLNIINNPEETLQMLLNNFTDNDDYVPENKEDWLANSIIDLFDWKKFDVTNNLSINQRLDLINTLKEHNFIDKLYNLKQQGVKEKDIASALFNQLIYDNDEIILTPKFNKEQLEYLVGYNRVEGTGLNLKTYQRQAADNIDRIFQTKQFTSAILPTGAGKSFIALYEMYRRKDQKILYLAPNNEILNQILRYIKKMFAPEEHLGERPKKIMKRVFPNLELVTCSYLTSENAKDILENQYDFIVFDELHRTGANEWNNYINELLNNQTDKTKVLGITATPERDVDFRNMSEVWARKYGYTDEEILNKNHLAMDMNLETAIRNNYVIHPKVVLCEYSLRQEIEEGINSIEDENVRDEKQKQYEKIRRNVESADGVDKIFTDNIKQGSKYIIFLPVTKKGNGTYENEDGEKIGKSTVDRVIKSYQTLIKQYMFSEEYTKDKNEILTNIYNKIESKIDLNENEIQFLNSEKDNLLLLTKINIYGKPNQLNTNINLIADTISKYMNWETLSEQEKTKILSKKSNDKIECSSMLGSYSNQKNQRNLDSFNNDNNSNKTKFMFVMNKLNEGVHVDNIDGIVWLRPMDENSTILYSQQLGRCIYAIDNIEEIKEEDRPLVIDLVNNTLKVNFERSETIEERDRKKLESAKIWIDSYGRNPEYNTVNDNEKKCYESLSYIYYKYKDYLTSKDLLVKLDVKANNTINSIINLGHKIGLWSMDLIEIKRIKDPSDPSNGSNDLLGLLSVNSTIRDLFELKENINSYCNTTLSNEERLEEIYNYYIENEHFPPFGDNTLRFSDDSAVMGTWISNNKEYILKQANEGNEYAKVIAQARRWIEGLGLTNEERLKEICNYYNEYGHLPSQGDNTLRFRGNSAVMGKWISDNKEYILKQADEGNEYAKVIVQARRWIEGLGLTNEERLEEIYNYYIEYGHLPSSQDKTLRFSDDSAVMGKWIAANKEYILKQADEGNEYAKVIVQARRWKEGLGLSKEERLEEIYNYYIENGHLPSSQDKTLRFRGNSAVMGEWISKNKEYILKQADEGNEHAKVIAQARNWPQFESSKEEFNKESKFEALSNSLENRKEDTNERTIS